MERIYRFFVFMMCIVVTSVYSQQTSVSKATTQQKQAKLTPEMVLKQLKEGNQRFMSGQMRNYNYLKDMKKTSYKGQFPKAIIFNCIDSRSIAETLFDQGLGNIFVSRIAGNVSSSDVVGGMEFATQMAGASLIVVMGHTHCGAVQGACLGGAKGDLGILLDKIKPAVETLESSASKPLQCKDMNTVDKIAKLNVVNQIKQVKSSPVIRDLMKSKQIEVVGAMHDISSGKVEFFDASGNPL